MATRTGSEGTAMQRETKLTRGGGLEAQRKAGLAVAADVDDNGEDQGGARPAKDWEPQEPMQGLRNAFPEAGLRDPSSKILVFQTSTRREGLEERTPASVGPRSRVDRVRHRSILASSQ
ncbi:unnamed protein product [Calypogeia fissa]